jgi:pSer/pThr/pTyr-binding forkhead associated (FHA) protein
VITCPKCSKDNQDHYKFCLGCGAELPRDVAPKPFAPQTPPQGMKAAQAAVAPPPAAPQAAPPAPVPLSFPQAAPPAAAAPPSAFKPQPAPPAPPPAAVAPPAPVGGTVICPQCGHVNGPSNVFCGSCGFRLGGQPARPAAAPPAPPPVETAGAIVLTALRADGSEAGSYNLPSGTQLVGRDTGGIFAGDSYLSPRHATFKQPGPGKLTVKDEASLNGVYKKLARDTPIELKPNDIFRIGQEIIRFEPLAPMAPSPDGVERLGAPSKGYVGRIALVIGRDTSGNAFPIPEAGIHIGRERGDVLFPEDGYVSGLHCRLAWENGRAMLTDLGSSNGSFIRLKEETDVRSGDVLLMGQQLFRVTM